MTCCERNATRYKVHYRYVSVDLYSISFLSDDDRSIWDDRFRLGCCRYGIIIIWRTIVHCTTTTTTTLNIRIHNIMAHETKQNCSQTWRICQSSHFLLDPCRSIHDTPYCTNSHTFPPKCLFECRQYASLPVVWHVFSVHGRGAYILHKVPSSKRNERNECE